MELLFYIAAAVAVAATVRVITHLHAVHALLYFVVSVLALALIFYLLGAAFAAALEIIVYAGAIIVLFIFVMLLNQGPLTVEQERRWLAPGIWWGPSLLALVLLGEVTAIIVLDDLPPTVPMGVRPKDVSMGLYGPYVIAVELASMLLLSGLIGAYHLGRRVSKERT
jgi:NADH-quinone oxidoreductase subunit J